MFLLFGYIHNYNWNWGWKPFSALHLFFCALILLRDHTPIASICIIVQNVKSYFTHHFSALAPISISASCISIWETKSIRRQILCRLVDLLHTPLAHVNCTRGEGGNDHISSTSNTCQCNGWNKTKIIIKMIIKMTTLKLNGSWEIQQMYAFCECRLQIFMLFFCIQLRILCLIELLWTYSNVLIVYRFHFNKIFTHGTSTQWKFFFFLMIFSFVWYSIQLAVVRPIAPMSLLYTSDTNHKY